MPRGRPDGPINPFPPFPGPFPGPGGIGPLIVTRRRRRGSLLPDTPTRQRGGFPAVPLPIPVPQPFPGPNIPAANEPFPPEIFGAGALGRILLGGAVGVIIFGTGAAVVKRAKELDEEREERERLAELEGILRREERQARDRMVKTMPTPDKVGPDLGQISLPRPDFEGAPIPAPRPGRVEVPIEIPEIELPGIEAPMPGPLEIPSPSAPPLPQPLPLPVPAPVPGIPGFGVPGPIPTPGPNPFPGPGAFPVGLPLPRVIPLPRGFPIGDPLPQPIPGLTPVQGPMLGFVELPDPSANPNPEQQRCREVKRRRRRRGKCMEGFYKEFPNRTQYIDWREVDCITRREI